MFSPSAGQLRDRLLVGGLPWTPMGNTGRQTVLTFSGCQNSSCGAGRLFPPLHRYLSLLQPVPDAPLLALTRVSALALPPSLPEPYGCTIFSGTVASICVAGSEGLVHLRMGGQNKAGAW